MQSCDPKGHSSGAPGALSWPSLQTVTMVTENSVSAVILTRSCSSQCLTETNSSNSQHRSPCFTDKPVAQTGYGRCQDCAL